MCQQKQAPVHDSQDLFSKTAFKQRVGLKQRLLRVPDTTDNAARPVAHLLLNLRAKAIAAGRVVAGLVTVDACVYTWGERGVQAPQPNSKHCFMYRHQHPEAHMGTCHSVPLYMSKQLPDVCFVCWETINGPLHSRARKTRTKSGYSGLVPKF